MGIIIPLLAMPTIQHHKISQKKLTFITQLYAKVPNLLAVLLQMLKDNFKSRLDSTYVINFQCLIVNKLHTVLLT